jgi:hypothetical protein
VAALGISGLAVPLVGFAAAGYFLVFLLLGIASPLVDEATQRATPSDQRATVGSVMSLAMQSGGVLANVVCGALAASVALPMGVGVIALGLVFGALAIGIGTDRRTEPSVEPEVGDPVAAGQPAGHA